MGEHKKLNYDFKQLGLYRIMGVLYQSSFDLEHVETKSIRKAHYNQLSMVDPNLQAEYGATTRGEAHWIPMILEGGRRDPGAGSRCLTIRTTQNQ